MPNLPCSTSAHETLYAKDGVLIKTCFYFFFPCVIIRDFEGEICMKLVRLPFRFPLLFPNISLWEHHLHLHVLLKHINLTTNFSLFRHNLKCATGMRYSPCYLSISSSCYSECLNYSTDFLDWRMRKSRFSRTMVSNLSGTKDWSSYENLRPDGLRRS